MHKLITRGAAAALLALTTLSASATVNKTWVSSTGTDGGTCQLAAPCKTFQFAHDQTSPGGEIDVKDTGSYGGLTITKAISIVSGDGALAAIGAPPNGTGITVAAGAQDKVVLQGLFVDGHGVASVGIAFKSGMSLTIQNCHVRNVSFIGISLQPVGAKLFNVVDTEVANAQSFGILIQPYNTQPLGSMSGLYLHDNAIGLLVGYMYMTVTNSSLVENETGLETENGGNVLLGQTTISGNTSYGIRTQGGNILSYGDNYINANQTDVS